MTHLFGIGIPLWVYLKGDENSFMGLSSPLFCSKAILLVFKQLAEHFFNLLMEHLNIRNSG